MGNIGVITEQGDLGLGFEPVTPEEEKTINETFGKTQEDNEKKDN